MVNGLMHGKGRWIKDQLDKRSDQYYGHFKFGLRDGQGLFTGKDGEIYSGSWKSGKRHGEGEASWPNKTTYKGQWMNDKKHGRGIFKIDENNILSGVFIQNEFYDPNKK